MIKEKILEKLKEALKKAGIQDTEIDLDHPANSNFGDYSSNIALRLAKKLKKNPIEMAEEIVKNLAENELIKKAEVIKPGFINFWISTKKLLEELTIINNEQDAYGKSQNLTGKKIIVEYTDPNPLKEFHIGHLYSNIVGESLARLMEALGAEVKRANYQGDVGIHVAKAIWGLMKKMKDEKITINDLEQKPLEERTKFLGEAYVLGTNSFEENEKSKEEIKQLNKVIYELSDPEINKLYRKGRQWSLEHFEEIYVRLGTRFDYYFFERDVGEKGIEIVKENLRKGIFKESEGAVIFEGENYGLHTRVFANSLGLPTYEAKELALAPAKYEKFPYDISLVVTGNEISEYFQVVMKALELISPDLRKKTKHITHGMVRLPEGKMSSRKGNVLTGEWLLDIAKKKAIEKMQEVVKQSKLETAEIVGTGAIKYALLKNRIGKNVDFDFNESISFEGNAGPYLQYTYVRCLSVMSKTEVKTNELVSSDLKLEKEELDLLRYLQKFSDVVELAGINYAPNIICTYLFNLAQKYNLFYQKHQILKADEPTKNFRLLLTQSVAQVIKNGLYLLGIKTVEKM